eukprot:TRINITY_DN8306_c2_g1_i1.p1 TRINITY_DN8306_c2_g1~~TRINITY_DN8306_c2_g1_i1.p1  ORF type:complete len:587 (+),score=86.01 TRINITY_DN8306_c2_g1_i1:29-1789(+)
MQIGPCIVAALVFLTLANERVPADPAEELSFTLTLRHRNMAEFQRRFRAITEPDSVEYRQYLSPGQVADILAPEVHKRQELHAFLTSSGCSLTEANTRDLLRCTIRAADAQPLFGVEFYRDSASPTTLRSEGTYQVPAEFEATISLIFGPEGRSTMVGEPESVVFEDEENASAPGTACQAAPGAHEEPVPLVVPEFPASPTKVLYDDPLTPITLKHLYRQLPAESATGDNEFCSLAVLTTGSYSPADLDAFLTRFDLPKDHPIEHRNFTNLPSSPALECTLDMQWGLGMAPKIHAVVQGLYGSVVGIEAWVNIAFSYFTTPNPARVWTVSYHAGDEYKHLRTLGLDRMNVEFQKMAITGATVLFSAGDSGSGCFLASPGKEFSVQFPSTSPYVTVVGGSKTLYNGTEEACVLSGGGFSTLFARPRYQRPAVEAYLANAENDLPKSELFNPVGRGVPDVAAEGCALALNYQGERLAFWGTSGSTPIFAGMLTLMNCIRHSQGLPPLGFLNPLMYAMKVHTPQALSNISRGETSRPRSCKDEDRSYGWRADAAGGWSPTVGLGTPRFDAFLAAAEQLPAHLQKKRKSP